MSRLLNALLDISKLESGAISPDPTDFSVASLFEAMRREFGGVAANKGITLQVDPVAENVYSDNSLVEQILRNLLSNAIKYTKEGFVRLSCLREDSSVRIDVLDTGIGIAKEQLGFIYDEFFQVGVPTNSSCDGYGLGLLLLAEAMSLSRRRQSEHRSALFASVSASELLKRITHRWFRQCPNPSA